MTLVSAQIGRQYVYFRIRQEGGKGSFGALIGGYQSYLPEPVRDGVPSSWKQIAREL